MKKIIQTLPMFIFAPDIIGFAAALIYNPPENFDPDRDEIRIAFDADAVIFPAESERIYQKDALEAFLENEKLNALRPLPEGPFGKLLKNLSLIKDKEYGSSRYIRITIVTARNNPAHKRVVLTLREWGVHVDEAFFLGGISKDKVLKAFNAHIFFDDQDTHAGPASKMIPAAQVPYQTQNPGGEAPDEL